MFQIIEEFFRLIHQQCFNGQSGIQNAMMLIFVLLMHNDQKDLDMKHATEGSFMYFVK